MFEYVGSDQLPLLGWEFNDRSFPAILARGSTE